MLLAKHDGMCLPLNERASPRRKRATVGRTHTTAVICKRRKDEAAGGSTSAAESQRGVSNAEPLVPSIIVTASGGAPINKPAPRAEEDRQRTRDRVATQYSVGMSVKARHLATSLGPFGTSFFPGRIASIDASRLMRIEYDDGDVEDNVSPMYVKPFPRRGEPVEPHVGTGGVPNPDRLPKDCPW